MRINRVLIPSPRSQRETLTWRATCYDFDSATQFFKFFRIRLEESVNAIAAFWKPFRPTEMSLTFDQVVLQRFKRPGIFFNSKNALPLCLMKTESKPATACEDVDISEQLAFKCFR